MTIGIIGAMEEEIQIIRQNMQEQKSHHIDNFTFFTGKLEGQDVVLLQSGIGKVNAAIGTTILNKEFPCDCIINIGSAGGLDPKLNIGDIVISSSLCYCDVDVTAFGYQFGQVPKMPHLYNPNSALIKLAKQSAQKTITQNVYTGLIISCDSFMNDMSKTLAFKEKFPEAYAVEMEACAIAQTCHILNVPFVIIRSISDKADHTSHVDFKEFLKLAVNNASKLITEMMIEVSNLEF